MSRASFSVDNKAVPKLLHALFAFVLCLVLLFTLHRRYWSDSHDPYKCSVLLNEGRWLDETPSPSSRPLYQKWQPPGCLLKEYKGDEITQCAGSRQLLFIGDSNVRQLFWAVAKKLDHGMSSPAGKYAERHGDIQLRPRGVDLRFVWDPYLNGSILANELEIYQESVLPTGRGDKAEVPVVMMVLGGGLWHARHYEAKAVREFKKSIDAITALATRRDGTEWKSKVPFKGWEGIGDQIFFMPVEEPVYKRLSPSRQATILPEEVVQMNEYLHRLEPSQGLTIPWVNQVMISQRPFAFEASGLHVLEPVAIRRADIILNLRCNAKLDISVGSPYDRTCCSKYTSGNWLQWLLIALTSVVTIMATFILFHGCTTIDPKSGTFNLSRIITLTASIGLSLVYCFFADRTQLFNKVQKLYLKPDFLTICGIALAIGCLSIRKSQPNSRQETVSEESPSAKGDPTSTSQIKLEYSGRSNTSLNPAQILELKGGTITFLLLAQYYAADHEPWIHIVSHLCISSQLFLVGYEHTLYFYITGDYSVCRVAKVLVRMNMLAVAVTYQMYTNYLFYYVAPLLSFWFLIVLATLRFGKELNGKVGFLVGKIVFSSAFTALAHRNDQPVNFIFAVLGAIFGIHWNGQDWRDHILTDPFMAFTGMLVALVSIGHGRLATCATTTLSKPQSTWTQRLLPHAIVYLPYIALFASLFTLPIFFYLTTSSFVESRGYDWDVHPYLSPLPILAYLCLRNSTKTLRAWHSEAWRRMGDFGVEIWVLSMHAWNAADGRGVLSLGVFADRKIDAITLGVMLVGGARAAGKACDGLTCLIVGNDQGTLTKGTSLPMMKEKDAIAKAETGRKSKRGVDGPGMRFAILLVMLWVLNLVIG